MLGDVDGDGAARAAEALAVGERAIGVACDVTRESDVTELLDAAASAFGRLDVMVNNAGVTRDTTMRKMTVEDFELVVDISLKGAWLGTRGASARMREQGRGGPSSTCRRSRARWATRVRPITVPPKPGSWA